MKHERSAWIAAAGLALAFWIWRAIVAPLPFYAFQSDPELTYVYSSVILANGFPLEHTDHPGTALQWVGAIMARLLGMRLEDVFDPVSLGRFFLAWRIVALASLLGCGAWLAHRLKGCGIFAAVLMCFLLPFDYQTLVYWLTFTPESAFFVLYLPVALFCAFQAGGSRPASFARGLLLSALLGFFTTIKLTLWPVTLFVLGLLAFPGLSRAQGWRRFAHFSSMSLLTYALAVSLFARDRAAPWGWAFSLLRHSGRYGTTQPGDGLFPPLSLGFEALQRSFALQAYTTLPVFAAVIGIALWSMRRREPVAGRSTWITSAMFIGALALLVTMFFKHPYQGKYLLPITVLMILYLAVQAKAGMLPPLRWLRPACVVFGLAALNAVLTQKLLFDYTIDRDHRVRERVDSWLAKIPHDALVFSSRLPHPLPAFRESLPSPLSPLFFRDFGPLELAVTYSLGFQRVSAPEVSPPAGSRSPLAFLNVATADVRWLLVDALPEDGLYVYRLRGAH